MKTTVHDTVMQLFADQALTLSTRGDTVSIHCPSPDDAVAVLDWLTQQRGNSVQFVGRASGDGGCFCWDDVPADQRDAIAEDTCTDVSGRLYPSALMSKLAADQCLCLFTAAAQPLPGQEYVAEDGR